MLYNICITCTDNFSVKTNVNHTLCHFNAFLSLKSADDVLYDRLIVWEGFPFNIALQHGEDVSV